MINDDKIEKSYHINNRNITRQVLVSFQQPVSKPTSRPPSESRVVLDVDFRTQTTRDNIAKDVQSHFIRGACLKQPNFNSKTYANNSKQHIYDGNACPEHRDVNWMV